MKKYLLVFLMTAMVLSFLASVAWGDNWGLFGAVPISRAQNEQIAVAAPQATMLFCNQPVWNWSAAENEFLRDVPSGIGAVIRIYPNVDANNLGIIGVCAYFGELPDAIHMQPNQYVGGMQGMCGPCLVQGCRDTCGRWYVDVSVDNYQGPQCLRILALVKGAKRSETTFLWIIRWTKRKNATQMVDKVEWTTSPWAGCRPTAPVQIATMMRRAGVGGSGLVYDQLASADLEPAPKPITSSTTTTTTTPSVTPTSSTEYPIPGNSQLQSTSLPEPPVTPTSSYMLVNNPAGSSVASVTGRRYALPEPVQTAPLAQPAPQPQKPNYTLVSYTPTSEAVTPAPEALPFLKVRYSFKITLNGKPCTDSDIAIGVRFVDSNGNASDEQPAAPVTTGMLNSRLNINAQGTYQYRIFDQGVPKTDWIDFKVNHEDEVIPVWPIFRAEQ